MSEHPVVLFDGVCNLCNASVGFIIDHDPQGIFRFSSLQSDTGQKLLRQYGLPTDEFQTITLIEHDRYFLKSTAALRIVRRFPWPWKLLSGFLVVPPFIRNAIYDVIAQNRYRWFGKQDICRIPTPELQVRFLS